MGMAVQDMSFVAKQIDVLSSIDWGFVLAMFLVYFVGGYLLYSSLFAAIGASVDNESDTGQFMMPITINVLVAASALKIAPSAVLLRKILFAERIHNTKR